MTIDPRYSIFLSLGLAILGFIAGAGAQFADLGMQPQTVKAILAFTTLLLGVGNAVNAVLAGIPAPNSTTGFIVGPPAPKDK
jgi:hypothetical protein